MNLHDLETFVSIARLGGVTRAAGQLHRSQPAITRRIKLLEDHLGAPLLERGRSGAMLTEAGRTFLPYAEAVLAALKDGTQAVQALQAGDHGAVSLAIVGTLAGTTIVDQLRRFSARDPGEPLGDRRQQPRGLRSGGHAASRRGCRAAAGERLRPLQGGRHIRWQHQGSLLHGARNLALCRSEEDVCLILPSSSWLATRRST